MTTPRQIFAFAAAVAVATIGQLAMFINAAALLHA